MKHFLILVSSFAFAQSLFAEEHKVVQGHVFAWPFTVAKEMQPRGGMTQGTEVTLDAKPSQAWQDLQEESLSDLEKDRRAILAMAGNYRVSFDFMELLGLTENYTPKKPYFSWATENITILEKKEKFISLQHTLVMFFKDKDGKMSEPMVMKHWRQDWTYEDQKRHVFVGNRTWKSQKENLKGGWTHAVFQVDDSPRYESTGRWTHAGGKSTWIGEAWRPLPRREFSVRDDYQVLKGRDEITLVPNGWVHFQNNSKLQLGKKQTILGQEIGVNRYERISSPSLDAAVENWNKTGAYWAEVRAVWREVYEQREEFTIRAKVDDKKLFQHHFGYAAKISQEGKYDPEKGKAHARETIFKFIDGAKARADRY